MSIVGGNGGVGGWFLYSFTHSSTYIEEAGLGKTHLVQDKSLGPGLHNQHYRFDTAEAG